MIICHCTGATDRDVRAAADRGMVSCQDVVRTCGAGTGCKGCLHTIRELIRDLETRKVSRTETPAA